MHIKEKVTGLWARRPRLSGTQGRALKGVTQFFAAMLVCTLIARGTAGATLAVVQTASPRRACTGADGGRSALRGRGAER